MIANVILFSIILLFIIWGLWKKINVYDAFVEGAKEGFTTAVRIIPYLVAFWWVLPYSALPVRWIC